MRVLILIAGALSLAGCGNNDQRDNTQNVGENLTAANIVSNDDQPTHRFPPNGRRDQGPPGLA